MLSSKQREGQLCSSLMALVGFLSLGPTYLHTVNGPRIYFTKEIHFVRSVGKHHFVFISVTRGTSLLPTKPAVTESQQKTGSIWKTVSLEHEKRK